MIRQTSPWCGISGSHVHVYNLLCPLYAPVTGEMEEKNHLLLLSRIISVGLHPETDVLDLCQRHTERFTALLPKHLDLTVVSPAGNSSGHSSSIKIRGPSPAHPEKAQACMLSAPLAEVSCRPLPLPIKTDIESSLPVN